MSRHSNVWPGKPYETVPVRIRRISSPSNGGRKCLREKHQALAVKGKRHPNYGMKSNPGCSRQDLNTGCSCERLTSYHGKKEQVVFIRAVVVTPVQGTLPWRCWHELTVLSFWYEQLLSLLLPLTGQWFSTIVQVLLVLNADVVLCRWGGQQMSEHYSRGHGPQEPPAQLIRTTCHGQEIVHTYRWL